MTRLQLPQKFIYPNNYKVDLFGNTSDWTVIAGNVTVNTDKMIDDIDGKDGLRFVNTTPTQMKARRALTTPTILNDTAYITFWINNITDLTKLSYMNCLISSDATGNFSKYFKADCTKATYSGTSLIDDVNKNKTGYLKIIVPISSFVSNGGESWNNAMTHVRFNIDSTQAPGVDITIRGLTAVKKNIPNRMIQFDDGWSGVYTAWQNILKPLKIRSTVWLCMGDTNRDDSKYLSEANKLTLDQIMEMYDDEDAPVDFGNHTWNHYDLTTLSYADQYEQIRLQRDWAIAHGLTRNDMHLHASSPRGCFNNDTLLAYKNLGFKTHRPTTAADRFSLYTPVSRECEDELFRMQTSSLEDWVLDSQFDLKNTQIRQNGQTAIFYTHNVEDTLTEDIHITTAKFAIHMNKIADDGILNLGITDWYDGKVRKQVNR